MCSRQDSVFIQAYFNQTELNHCADDVSVIAYQVLFSILACFLFVGLVVSLLAVVSSKNRNSRILLAQSMVPSLLAFIETILIASKSANTTVLVVIHGLTMSTLGLGILLGIKAFQHVATRILATKGLKDGWYSSKEMNTAVFVLCCAYFTLNFIFLSVLFPLTTVGLENQESYWISGNYIDRQFFWDMGMICGLVFAFTIISQSILSMWVVLRSVEKSLHDVKNMVSSENPGMKKMVFKLKFGIFLCVICFLILSTILILSMYQFGVGPAWYLIWIYIASGVGTFQGYVILIYSPRLHGCRERILKMVSPTHTNSKAISVLKS